VTAHSSAGPTLVVLQPGYLPWLGFFDQLRRADVFVYYDDVQYDTHGWRNRNRIKTPQGPLWLTVPVRHAGLNKPRILDVEIDPRSTWARKHVQSIRQAYAGALCLADYLPPLEELLLRRWERLVDLDIAVTGLMAEWLGLRRRIVRASDLGIGGGQSERLVSLCRHFGASTYLSGAAARDYLDVPLFAAQGIDVRWQEFVHPTYRPLHGAVVPYLSALDVVLNEGEGAAALLEGARRLI
jgi:hypothetical protein